ncbi:unnamed protein product [Soboliphyme baturini]|uniref:Protein sleepless n=1 Tax=Soboliphyme baturini TaxID=241478 RepID=A0A183J7X6_9BILA|nr:unnamed protein product [Soboliphyme baturini]
MPFRGFIRGCYDSMLVHGFNKTIVHWYQWLERESCHFYNKQDVLQLPYRSTNHVNRNPNHLYLCTCYSDGCNGQSQHSAPHMNWKLFQLPPPLLPTMCLFMSWLWTTRTS